MGYRANLRVVPETAPFLACPKCGERDHELFDGIRCRACSWIWVPTNAERAAFFCGAASVAERVASDVRRGRLGGFVCRAFLAGGRLVAAIGAALGKANR